MKYREATCEPDTALEAVGVTRGVIEKPQAPQNCFPGETSELHLGHRDRVGAAGATSVVIGAAVNDAIAAIAAPQLPQNFLPSPISALHFGQIIPYSLYEAIKWTARNRSS